MDRMRGGGGKKWTVNSFLGSFCLLNESPPLMKYLSFGL